MTKTITAAVGMDYDRGLAMLKEKLETGNVTSKIEYEGKSHFEGYKYIGINRTTSMDKMGSEMSDDLTKLGKWAEDHKDDVKDVPFTIYQ